MKRRYWWLFMLAVVAALGGYLFWVAPAFGIAFRGQPTVLKVVPPAKLTSTTSRPLTLELTGTGLERGTRAWLVPETSQRLTVHKTLQTAGQPRRMVLSGKRVYIANNAAGLLLLDVSNWAAPKLLGSLTLPGHAMALVVRDDTAFVAAGLAGLLIVDCSNPSAPQLVSRLRTPGPATAVSLSGQTAFLGCARSGVQAIDVSRLAHPVPLGHLEIPQLIVDVAATETTLLVTVGRDGGMVVDTSDPRALYIRARFQTPGSANRVAITGEQVLVTSGTGERAAGRNALSLYRLTGGALQLQSEIPLPAAPYDLCMENQQASLALADNGVLTYAIDDPFHPRLLRKLENYGRIRSLVSAGDWLLLTAPGGQLLLVRPADQLQLPVAGQVPTSSMHNTRVSLQQIGQQLFVATRGSTLQIFDVVEPVAPKLLGELTLAGELYALTVKEEQLWLGFKLASGAGLLQTWSISNPQRPRLLEERSFAAPVGRVAVDGHWLAVAEANNDPTTVPINARPRPPAPGVLHIIDRSLPSPERGKRLELEADAQSLVFARGYLLAQVSGTLHAITFGDSSPPQVVDSLNFSWLHATSPRKVSINIEVRGQTAILASGDTELNFVDISVPSRLTLFGSIEMPGAIAMLAADEQLLLVGLYDRGVMAFDISRPWRPQQIGLLPVPAGTAYFALGSEAVWFGGQYRFGVVGVPRPLQAVARSDARGEQLELQIARPRAAGDYSLWVERDNQWQELPNCIRFAEEG